MLRDFLDRLACRYQLWSAETRSQHVGAGESAPEVSPATESASHMIFRLLWVLAGGLLLLGALYRVSIRTFPSFRDGIPFAFIFLAVVWSGTVLFLIVGELLTKYSKSDDNDQSI
jgi:hypothetical protein